MQDIDDIMEIIDEIKDRQTQCDELAHYCPISTLDSIVRDYQKSNDQTVIVLRATDAFNTNDRLEMQLGYEYTLKLFSSFENDLSNEYNIEKYKISTYLNDVKRSDKFKQYTENDIKNFLLSGDSTPYVISFTRRRDDIDMWQKYGSAGYGICLIFNKNKLLHMEAQNGLTIHDPMPIVYGDRLGLNKTKTIMIMLVYLAYCEFINTAKLVSEHNELTELKIRALDQVTNIISAYIKSEDWHTERETRIAVTRNFRNQLQQPEIKQNEKGRSFVEIKVPLKSLTNIIIGPCVTDADVNKVISLAKNLGLPEENVTISNKPLQ